MVNIKYLHYKGGIYTYLGVGTHSETLEKMVVYMNERGETWIRPYNMFFSDVEVKGKIVPRFKKID